MTKKIIYSATLGTASSDFFAIEQYDGKGVYVGTRVKADDKLLDLYYKELDKDKIERPASVGIVTLLRPLRYGDAFNSDSKLDPKTLFSVIVDHHDRNLGPMANEAKRKKVDDLYYVGKDYAGKLHAVKPLLNAWDRETVRTGIAKFLKENCHRLYHYFNGYEVDIIHNTCRG